MDPLELLPQEVWKIIFEKVEDPQDWLNLYRASKTFEGVVGDKRPVVLVAKAFPHLQNYLDGNDLNGLLSLRLVSKTWKKAVDTSLESLGNSFYVVGDREHWEQMKFRKLLNKYDFQSYGMISRFLENFGTRYPPGNPFVGNFVRFLFSSFNEEEVITGFRRSVEQVMDRFGSQIKKLCIIGGTRLANLDFFVEEVRSVVQLAPNLESLTVHFLYLQNLEYADLRLDHPIILGSMPLPIIQNLKSFLFIVYNESNVMRELQDTLERLFCNTETLKIRRGP